MQGRCMKCKDQRDMINVEITKTPKGGFMAKGKCKQCQTGVCKILSGANAELAIKSGEAKKSY